MHVLFLQATFLILLIIAFWFQLLYPCVESPLRASSYSFSATPGWTVAIYIVISLATSITDGFLLYSALAHFLLYWLSIRILVC